MNRRALVVPIAVAVSLGLSACGGDDGADKLSKSALASKTDEICKEAKAKADKVDTPSNIRDAGAAAAYFGELSDITEEQTSKLEDLEPADDAKDDWEAFLTAQKAATELITKTRDAAVDKDPSGLTEFQAEAPKIGQDVDAAAKKIGATCT